MWGMWVVIAIVFGPAVVLTVLIARRRGLLLAFLAALLALVGAAAAAAGAAVYLPEWLPLAVIALVWSGLPAAGPAAILLFTRSPKG